MKLMIVILDDRISEKCTKSLVEGGLSVTKIASTGGFMRQGRTTLLIGLEEEQVDNTIDLIRNQSNSEGSDENQKSTVFVLNAERYEQV